MFNFQSFDIDGFEGADLGVLVWFSPGIEAGGKATEKSNNSKTQQEDELTLQATNPNFSTASMNRLLPHVLQKQWRTDFCLAPSC